MSSNTKVFHETLLKQSSLKSNVKKQKYLNFLDTKTFTNQQWDLYKIEIQGTNLLESMKNIKNKKNYWWWWINKRTLEKFLGSNKISTNENYLSGISQRQTVIKLIQNKNHDKRYIKNWRPISLLNIDT